MYFSQLVQKRESTRRYSPTPVEREKIIQITEACRLAPSACNAQPWRIIIADNKKVVADLARASYGPLRSFNKFVTQAPVIAAIIEEKPNWLSRFGSEIKDKDFHLMDIGIVAEHFCLQAADLGLGTCMLGWFDEARAREILNVPSNKRILLLITLGYPARDRGRKKVRKTLNEIMSWNSYQIL